MGQGLGGLQAIEKRNQAKAELVYKAIDESGVTIGVTPNQIVPA